MNQTTLQPNPKKKNKLIQHFGTPGWWEGFAIGAISAIAFWILVID